MILAAGVSIAVLVGASTAALVERSARAGRPAVVAPVGASTLEAAPSPGATDMAQWNPSFVTYSPGRRSAVSSVAMAPGTTELVSPLPGATYLLYWFDPSQPVVGELSATTWGGPTVRPVIAAMGDFLEIRLDSRPNGSTGWVRKEDVAISTTPYRIVISVSQRSLTLFQDGSDVYSSPVGVGRPQWPTPTGPSFVDAKVPTPANEQRVYGPLVVITGTHSDVFTEFDGGDGTVGIHGYPSDPASTKGVASSHGCVRANPTTIAMISVVPVGTPIDINP